MTQLPDVACLIKVLNGDGKRIHGGAIVGTEATVRYVAFNDSNMKAGPFNLEGSLWRDGVRVKHNGHDVVPKQAITLQPGEIWTVEFEVQEGVGPHIYMAYMAADVGGLFPISVVDEEDETNNKANTGFLISPHSL
jgi:hypothetical protein